MRLRLIPVMWVIGAISWALQGEYAFAILWLLIAYLFKDY